ncbi:FkbM family methyltransferase [Zunongwangia sp. F260]|uniref:FkbM family methyltransferase n=1 Tax=Autumnicola lenta TaxID=3075593 RepID=A0ABU3CG40_9FLAO|nr:FkbM family methyltransferase [Zunongwangia sp. F260]MDT0645319.1 FkbM family methyltransferase [Zunongwangia sp. F260]
MKHNQLINSFYLKNKIIIFVLKFLNKWGRGFVLKNKIFSSKGVLERNFPLKSEFYFIQVGANDGVSFDFLYEFVINRKSSGIVIEPVKEYFYELVNNYKDYPQIKKINKAVHSLDKSKIIYKIKESSKHKYPDWVKGIASFDERHHKKTNISKEDIEIENVLSDTLMNIISETNSIKRIDYLQIDTEGYDLEILKMLDFYNIKPLLIKYEHVNLEKADFISARKLLTDQGYSVYKEGNDTLGIDLHRINLL